MQASLLLLENPLKTILSCYFGPDLDMQQTEDIW
jgi:hypothetical protein